MPDRSTEVLAYARDSLIFQRLLPPGAYVIGGEGRANIRLQADDVRARHALLSIGESSWEIESLGDSEVRVGERVVTGRSTISPEEEIRVGAATLRLRRIGQSPRPEGGMPSAVRSLLPAFFHNEKKFEVGHQVAEGGQGVIMDAHEIAVQRTVAMKLLRDCGNGPAVVRFIQEAQITAQLEHPNIVPIHELSVNELEQPYYTMKFVRGTSLGHVLAMLRRRDPATVLRYPLSTLLTIFQKVCDAIAFAHSRGVIHRDIKPDNVMLGEYGEALLMDWGLAKYLDRESPVADWGEKRWRVGGPGDGAPGSEVFGSTMVGTVVGTPQYMSPEQASGEVLHLSATTDIYAIGALLYHILTLEVPFGGIEPDEVLAKVRAGELLPFHRGTKAAKLPHLPGGRVDDSLVAVVRRAMSLKPEERYASVKDLQADLHAYQSGFATMAENAGAWKLAKLFLRRHRTVSIAAALLVFSGIGFTAYTVKQRRVADRASKEAVEARKIADAERDIAEEHLYRTHMLEAGRHIADGRPASAEAVLLQHRRESTGRDLRGWEWFYNFAQLNRERLRVRAHRDGVFAIAVSADGSRVATAGGDGEIAIWESRGLAPVFRVAAHHGTAYAVAWHDGGRYAASGGADGFVRVWDVAEQRQVAEARLDSGKAVRALAWRPGAEGEPVLAIGGIDPKLYEWTPLADGEAGKMKLFTTTDRGVLALQWMADGASLLMGAVDSDRALVLHDAETRQPLVPRHGLDSDIFAVAASPRGSRFAAGSKHRRVGIFDLGEDGAVARTVEMPAHRGFVSALAWSPDGERLISAGLDGTIRAFSRETGWKAVILCSQPGEIHALAWARIGSPDRAETDVEAIFSGSADGTLRAWSPHPAQDVTFEAEGNWISTAAWSPGGRQIAAANFRRQITLLDPATGRGLPVPGLKGGVFDLAWSPSGDRIATASRGGDGVEIFARADGRLIGRLPMPEPDRVLWHPEGRTLVGCGHRGARCWDAATARLRWEIPGEIGSVAWIDGATKIMAGGADGSLRLFDAASGARLEDWKKAPPEMPGSLPSEHEPPRQIFDLAESPDGRWVAYGAQDGAAGLLDLRDRSRALAFPGHTSGIWRIGWRPDGTRLATAGQDGTLRIFNALNGSQVVNFDHGDGASSIHSVSWDRTGNRLLTGGLDYKIRLWDATRGYLIEHVEALESHCAASPDDLKAWRELADACTALGWPDRAREAFGKIKELAEESPELAAAQSRADAVFARALEGAAIPEAPDAAGDGSFHLSAEAAALIRKIDESIRGRMMHTALNAWRELARRKDGQALLPFARNLFSAVGEWKVTWFSSPSDPVADLDGWRNSAAGKDVVTMPFLSFPFAGRSPEGLGLRKSEPERDPDMPVFNMIATNRFMLPAGKWRCSVAGGEGCRVMLNERTVIERWTETMEPRVTEDFEQDGSFEVTVRVESFLRKPAEHFEFTIEPLQ